MNQDEDLTETAVQTQKQGSLLENEDDLAETILLVTEKKSTPLPEVGGDLAETGLLAGYKSPPSEMT